MTSSGVVDRCIGIVGAGAMGQGIAQVAIQGGLRTLLFDAVNGAADLALQKVRDRLDRLVNKGRLDRHDAKVAAKHLIPVGSLEMFAPCDVVIEAIVEDVDAKHALFREIEAVVRRDCIIASNTSSIPIARLASA